MGNIATVCRGKWKQILIAMGIDAHILNGKHHPCPVNGHKGNGTLPFRFSNKDGKGNYFCACSDGKEDGFGLMKCKLGLEFKEACREVEKIVGDLGYDGDVAKAQDKEGAGKTINQLVNASRKLGPDARAYLASRGIKDPPMTLREVTTSYGIERKLTAIIGRIRDVNGEPISLHMTYLEGAQKAPEGRRIVTSSTGTIKGGAVRLFDVGADGKLGVAEGIETAISAHLLFGLPVWALLSTSGMESFEWPPNVKELHIFGDNDVKYGGQKAAYALAHRASIARTPVPLVNVYLPIRAGNDYNDELRGV